MSSLVHDRTSVHNIGYHIVWSVKYRRKVLVGDVEISLKNILHKIAEDKGFTIHEMECDIDHIHVFASAKPKVAPSYIYKMMKGISARRLFVRHPELKSKLWGEHLWNPSTYIETIGHISENTVRKYIEDQKKK
ncbi:MAG: IS200/IS605 family transposase [Mariprofundaceae bacterium]|nr:IS200/IS605 family transposase [Mariprofundaceae bacterium]